MKYKKQLDENILGSLLFQVHITKKIVSSWEELAQKEYCKAGVSVFRVESNSTLRGPNTKKISYDVQNELCSTLQAQMGDVIVLAIGEMNHAVCILRHILLYIYPVSLK